MSNTSQPADEPADVSPDSEEQLRTTAEHWREGHEGTEADDSSAEVAEGAERAAEQPDFGREGS